MAPAMVPMPPENDVPPMTAAAITYSSSRVPALLVAAFSRAMEMHALMPTRNPIRVKILSNVRRVLMPASSAASGLPP